MSNNQNRTINLNAFLVSYQTGTNKINNTFAQIGYGMITILALASCIGFLQ